MTPRGGIYGDFYGDGREVTPLTNNDFAKGCCSSVQPCNHQKRDPYSICETCRQARGLLIGNDHA